MNKTWIKLSTQKPEQNKEVVFFAYMDDRSEPELVFAGSMNEYGYIHVTGASGFDSENDFRDYEVTHWRELPEFPDMDEVKSELALRKPVFVKNEEPDPVLVKFLEEMGTGAKLGIDTSPIEKLSFYKKEE